MKTKSSHYTITGLMMVAACALLMATASAQTNGERKLQVKVKAADGSLLELYEESHALIIGVSDYANGLPSLPGVMRDVTEINTVLKKHGFQVETLLNPTRASFDQTMRAFIRRWGQAERNRLLFYFAGHGYTLKMNDGREVGYVVPADAPMPTRDMAAFKETAISMDEIEVYARRIESKHVLFVFDSCFSGALFEAMRPLNDAIVSKTALPVRQFITAGTAEQTVPDNSIFSRQFVEGLNGAADYDKDGYVTGSELGMYLENTVTNYSRRAQTPRYGKIRDPKLDKGDFVFVMPPKENPAPLAESGNKISSELSSTPGVPNADLYIKTGDKLASEKKWTQAEAEYRQATQAEPKNSEYHAKLAGALSGQQKWAEAEVEYRQAAQLDANNAQPHANLGYNLLKLYKWAAAEAEFQQAVKLEPQNALRHAQLGDCFYAQRKWADAETAYRRAVQLRPDNAFWHAQLGNALFQQENHSESETEYRQAVRLEPNKGDYHARLGLALSKQQNYVEAESHFRDAIQLEPKNASHHNNLGATLERERKYAEAEKEYMEAVRLDAQKPLYQDNLERIRRIQKK